jgi:hypothetical protein
MKKQPIDVGRRKLCDIKKAYMLASGNERNFYACYL